MNEVPTYSAVLLAGGRSRRMGTDKALLPIDGIALWQRQWALLAKLKVAEIFLSARADQQWVPPQVRVVSDRVPDAGPLAGIEAALTQMKSTHLIVLAVDLPWMEAGWLEELKRYCSPDVGAVGRRDEFFEPLAAIYPGTLRQRAHEALAKGDCALQRFIREAGSAMHSIAIDEDRAGLFANWNEPSDTAAG